MHFRMFLLLTFLLTFASVVSPHPDPRPGSSSSSSGCCGDIPDSLIWTLSFFILIGILIVFGTFFTYDDNHNNNNNQDTTTTNTTNERIINVRINPSDIKSIVHEIHELTRSGADTL